MCSDNDGGRAASTSLSFRESSVAEGMAMAFLPDESRAQQSEQPSAIQSASPARTIFSTGRL